MERKNEVYTLKKLILAIREEYLEQLEELKKMEALAVPISRKADRVEFKFSGSIISSDIVCETVKKITKLDELLNRTDRIILSSSYISSCDAIPYFLKDAKEFEEIKDVIVNSDYYKKVGNVVKFGDKNNSYLLQTTVEEVRLLKMDNKTNKYQEIVFKDGDSLFLGDNTEIADALNMMNTKLPQDRMDKYHLGIMDRVDDIHSLRVVDARKADTVSNSGSVVLVAKRK